MDNIKYVVMVRCDFRTDFGWDYNIEEYTGIRHTDKRKAEAEVRRAYKEGCYAFIKEVE